MTEIRIDQMALIETDDPELKTRLERLRDDFPSLMHCEAGVWVTMPDFVRIDAPDWLKAQKADFDRKYSLERKTPGPYTVEELKDLPYGSWIWVRALDGHARDLLNGMRGAYIKKTEQMWEPDRYLTLAWPGCHVSLKYEEYGTGWLAWSVCQDPFSSEEETT